MAKILAGAIGDCIHVIGVRNFLAIAEQAGFECVFVGGAVPLSGLVEAILREDPDIVGISYRLSPDVCRQLLRALHAELQAVNAFGDRIYLFGGTAETGQAAREAGYFDEVFDGRQSQAEVIAFVKNLAGARDDLHLPRPSPPSTLSGRIEQSRPFPILRHHVGLPSVDETVEAVREIATAEVLDVISIAPDQVAQESFFRPDVQEPNRAGAGGVPIRTHVDLIRIFEATRRGNFPLTRCYSGTQDVEQWAALLLDTISNAWSAIPLTWYNRMDKRGPRTIEESITQAQHLMRWHAQRGIPVEVNEPHQWGLRRASDAVSVATAFMAAHNAKKAGVTTYVSQYMLGTPAGISPAMDLAKALAMIEVVESLHDSRFHSYREVRPGLASFPSGEVESCAQLVFSVLIGMALKPDIFHVVACCEARHVARALDIIDSCRMARWAISEYMRGTPGEGLLTTDVVQSRKRELISEANAILEAIASLADDDADPLSSPAVIVRAIRAGILDAPDLAGSDVARGKTATAIVGGACVSVDPATGNPVTEQARVRAILEQEVEP
jgi:methylmalonyl-CoA mutase cobalamin-binding subunit